VFSAGVLLQFTDEAVNDNVDDSCCVLRMCLSCILVCTQPHHFGGFAPRQTLSVGLSADLSAVAQFLASIEHSMLLQGLHSVRMDSVGTRELHSGGASRPCVSG
jgi:hypothetical protein